MQTLPHDPPAGNLDAQWSWPPSELLMQIANDGNLDNFKASLPQVRHFVFEYVRQAGDDFRRFENILDLGCGVGRFLYAMQPLLGPHQKLYGCDVNEQCANFSSNNIGFADVYHNELLPPLRYPDNHFDFIYGLSVFTHLSIDLQFRWAWELHRVLKPGGLLFLSTAGMGFLIRAFQVEHIFPVKRFYTIGEDAFFGLFATAADDQFEGQREVATVHSLQAVRSIFSVFSMTKQIAISGMSSGQTVNLMHKPGAPLLQPLGLETNFSGSPAVLRTDSQRSTTVEFEFASGRNGCVRLALEFGVEQYGGDRLKLCCIPFYNGVQARQAETPFGLNSAYGINHLVEIDLQFEPRDEPLSLLVWLEATVPQLFPTDIPFVYRFVRSEARLD